MAGEPTKTASKEIASVLDRIVAARRASLERQKLRVPLAALERRAAETPACRDFARALAEEGIHIIAELKKASPSRGILRENYNPAVLAAVLERAGAAALSILTEEEFFSGSLEHLENARAVSRLPLLRKDFILDEYQVLEARAAGADAFLLIASILDEATLQRLLAFGRALGLAALVEVHDEAELDRALQAGVQMIGVNNRDLRTFTVSLDTSLRLIERIPDDRTAVTESGLRSGDDLRRLRDAGFDGFLIGEFLMQAMNPADALKELLRSARSEPDSGERGRP